MIKNIVISIVVVPIISIFFAYTKANIYSFWLGFLLCLFTEFFILIVYCFLKLQKAYRDSRNIKLENGTLNFENDYPMPTLNIAKEIYLNKFTEQARLTNKKESVVEPQLSTEFKEIQLVDKMPIKQTLLNYLEQVRNKYHCLNYFNQALINFGNRMMVVAERSLFLKGIFNFCKSQKCFVNEKFEEQLQFEQKKMFKQLKIALKKPKNRGQNETAQQKMSEDLQNIVLPNWKAVTSSLTRLGTEFREMEQIKDSNRQILEMIHRKIMEQYQILQKEISQSVSMISESRQNLQDLRRQHQKLEKYQTYNQGNDNIQIIYWLKKQYFDFTNLVLRIKQNQKNYKLHTQKLIYCQAKLISFSQKQQHKYDQIIHTRCYAFLDAYRITLEESLKMIREAFSEEGYVYQLQRGPPKVKEPAKSKNINEIIATEQQYQVEYFERVDYYLNKIDNFISNLEEMNIFLDKLRSMFVEIRSNLNLDSKYTTIIEKEGQKQRKPLLLGSLFETLTLQSDRIHLIILNLQNVNKQVIDINFPSLTEIANHIRLLCAKAKHVTSTFDLNEGPLRQKYRISRQQLNHLYKQIEQSISAVKQFQQLFQLHSNRIKKIIISSITLFVVNQKKCVMSYFQNDSTFKKVQNQSDLSEIHEIQEPHEEKLTEKIELNLQIVNKLETRILFCEQYRALINRFFFVAYTEWSSSQLFRQTISKEIYIALNQDINQYFSQIIVEDFEASGMPPEILWLKQLNSEQGEFIIDFNVSFRGKILIKISTKINFVTSIPVEFELLIQQFYAIIRLCFIRNQMGSSWISFVGEPLAKIVVRPKIGSLNINMTSVAGLLQNVILGKLKQNIYPIKKKITIPLYKKDQAYEIIQKRYESMAM